MSKNILNTLKEIAEKNLKILKNDVVRAVIITVVVILVIGVSGYVVYLKDNSGGIKVLTAEAISQKTINYINDNILKGQGTVSLKGEVKEENGLYKFILTFDVNGQKQDSDVYVTRDGKYLFPVMQGLPIDLDAKVAAGTATEQISTCADMPKADKPILDAFIVSQCPYGLQMQRVLAKAIEQGVSPDNIKVRYIGSISNNKISSMHGDAEAQENLSQICIREEQKTKYWDYISCYIEKGEADKCLTSTGIDKNQLNACVSDVSRGLKYAQEDFTLADQYSVGGSPTLIMADKQINEISFDDRDVPANKKARTADAIKDIMCCAFNNQPGYCANDFSKDPVASSFSTTYISSSAASNSASCGE